MDTLDLIQNMIKQDSKNKWGVVKQNLEALCDILPCSISFGHLSPQYEGYLTKFLVFNSEDEKTGTITYITNILNEMKIAFDDVILKSFTQMEATLKYLIEKMDKLNSYRKYAKNKKSKGTFINMFNFLVHEKDCILTSSDKEIFSIIDDTLRNPRNIIVHDIMKIFTYDDAIDFIDDGVNIDSKLVAFCSRYIDSVNTIIDLVGIFFEICRKHFL